MNKEEKLMQEYQESQQLLEHLKKIGFSNDEMEYLVGKYSFEQLLLMFNNVSQDRISYDDLKTLLQNDMKKEKELSIDDIVDEDVEIEKDSDSLNDLVENGDIYAPAIEKNTSTKEKYKSFLDEQKEIISKFNQEKSTSSLGQLVYHSLNPSKNINTIVLNGDNNEEPHLTVNNDTKFDWIENGKYLSVDDLRDSLKQFYKEHKKEKYGIIMPDGKVVKYKISKQNINQIGKMIKESSQILLGDKKPNVENWQDDIRTSSLVSIDPKNINIVHQNISNINLGKKADDDKDFPAGRYVPEEDIKQALVGIFRRTTPWGVLKSYITTMGKEQSMVDRAIEGSRGK